MTCYRLHDDLSFCQVDERLVFLDIGNDRYFQLSPLMEQALTAYLRDDRNPGLDIRPLVDRKILVEHPGNPAEARLAGSPASRSAMEAPQPQARISFADFLEVLAIVLHTQLELKLFRLKRALGKATINRPSQAVLTATSSEQQLLNAAAIYRRARLYVPVEMRCLLDSLSMTKFLRRRKLYTQVVFGIALDPFSAHCWTQTGDLVLNDTLGNVNSHTPIRIV